jgi:hypothetical protein
MSRKYAHERGFVSDRRIRSRGYLSVGVNYCFRNNMDRGRRAFLRSILLNPFEWKSYFNLVLTLIGSRNFVKFKKMKTRMRLSMHNGSVLKKY